MAVIFNVSLLLFHFLFQLGTTDNILLNASYFNTEVEESINKQVKMFKDSSNLLGFVDVKGTVSQSFNPQERIKENTTYWYTFSIENKSTTLNEVILEIGKIDSVELYIVQEQRLTEVLQLGRMVANESKSYQWGSWDLVWSKLVLQPNAIVDVYVKAKNISKMGASLDFKLVKAEEKTFNTFLTNLLQGFFQGFMLMMVVVGILFYLYTKRVGYLYYSFYSLLLAFSFISVYGYTRFLTNSFTTDYFLWALLSQFGAICYMQFIRYILEVKQVSLKLDRLILFLIFIRFIGLFFVFYNTVIQVDLSIVQNTVLLVDIISVVIGTVVIIYLMIRGNTFAKYALLGTAVLILGVMLAVLAAISLFTIRPEFFTQTGVTLQCIILSIGLSNELRDRAKGELQAKQEIIALKEKANAELEQKVKERTLKLKTANDEISVQNEELRSKQEEIQSQRDAIEVKNKDLNSKNLRIQSSMKAAQTIQKAILPKEALLKNLFKSHFVINKPKDVVSGDFFWLTQMDDGKIILVVADCTGHGVPGALMTMINHILLDKIIKLWKTTSPSQIFEILHNEIYNVLNQDESGDQNGVDASIVCIDKNKATLTFCGARNHLYYGSTSERKINIIHGSRKGVGGKQDAEKEFENHEIPLTQDMILYLGSDGLTDQPNKERRKYSRPKLEQTLQENIHLPLEQQKEVLLQSLEHFMKNTSQRDDILWMGIQL